LNQYPDQEKVNIIMSEVIEHNTKENALSLIKRALGLNLHRLLSLHQMLILINIIAKQWSEDMMIINLNHQLMNLRN
jgi:hypothetical protein